jgi:hypothetical protein
MYYFIVSVGQESRWGLAQRLSQPRCDQVLLVPSFQAHAQVVGSIPFLVGYLSEGIHSSPDVGQRPLPVPCHVGLSVGSSPIEADFPQRAKEGKQASLCNLILEMISRRLC